MKRLMGATIGAALFVTVLVFTARAEPPAPGQVDFAALAEVSGGSTVEVNLQGALLSIAARIASKAEPEAADLLKSLKQVRVNVFKVDDANRAEIQSSIKSIRAQLEAQQWAQIVSVKEKNEDVGVYVKTRGEEAIEGIVVTVMEAKGEAVFVNIVGDIKPDQLATIADKLNIDPLKKVSRKAKS